MQIHETNVNKPGNRNRETFSTQLVIPLVSHNDSIHSIEQLPSGDPPLQNSGGSSPKRKSVFKLMHSTFDQNKISLADRSLDDHKMMNLKTQFLESEEEALKGANERLAGENSSPNFRIKQNSPGGNATPAKINTVSK